MAKGTSKGAPTRAGGQGTGHLKSASVKAFGQKPKPGKHGTMK